MLKSHSRSAHSALTQSRSPPGEQTKPLSHAASCQLHSRMNHIIAVYGPADARTGPRRANEQENQQSRWPTPPMDTRSLKGVTDTLQTSWERTVYLMEEERSGPPELLTQCTKRKSRSCYFMSVFCERGIRPVEPPIYILQPSLATARCCHSNLAVYIDLGRLHNLFRWSSSDHTSIDERDIEHMKT
ncbi:hypothetical protein EVAR_102707_1 [Eumeta japonica]|uniref:Uncharacterized protein n=1 Tax=Eumeta variegata TaxID=151549 RepID=A0A4C1THL7_EUMVA|nr:hypothetical protein EVAR_102707_1 [Eumeta japonica]